MAGFERNGRGKQQVWTDSGWGCQRAKQQSLKDHQDTITHKEAANLQSNQINMKEAVKTAILQHNSVLLNLTSIILSMAKNHNSLCSLKVWCACVSVLVIVCLCVFVCVCRLCVFVTICVCIF